MSLAPLSRSIIGDSRQTCRINFTQVRNSFYNKYKHGPTRASNPRPDYVQWVKDAFGPEGKEFIIKHAKRLTKNPFADPIGRVYKPGELKIIERFRSEERVKLWKPVADSDSKNGFSISTISLTPEGYGCFKGLLDNRIPDDGLTQKSGFVAAIGPRKPVEKFLQTDSSYDWGHYNIIEMKIRGDGRKYILAVNCGRYDTDLAHYDMFGFHLHTRGGPYWQTIKLPVSRLVFTSKGIVQNEQLPMEKIDVKFIALVLQDTYDGPFRLEIDYIGLKLEHRPFKEDIAYEMYAYPHINFRNIVPGCDPPDTE